MASRLKKGQRQEQIVAGAMRHFARHGFRGCSTRAVARELGISETLIFRHFPSKDALYRAIIRQRIRDVGDGLLPKAQARARDDRGVLASIADTAIRNTERDPSFMRLLFHSALEGHPLASRFQAQRIQPTSRFLSDYIRLRIREGAFRRGLDPVLAARAFHGMVFNHCLTQHLFPGPRPFLRSRVVAAFVDLALRGMRR